MPIQDPDITVWEPTPPPPSTGAPAPSTTAAFDAPPLRLPVPMFRQKKKNWCWAACIQMIAAYYESEFTQCQIAQLLFTERNCCSNQRSCDEGCDPEDVKEVLRSDEMQIECRRFSQDLSFETVETEIREERPVAAAVLWFADDGEPRGGHLILIKGCHTKNNRQYVKVNDPFYGRGDVPFSKLKHYYGPEDDDQDGVWEHTWTKIAR